VAGHGKPREPEFLPPLALPKAVVQSALALSLVQCARGSSVMIGSGECHDWAQAERCHDVLPRGRDLGREQPGDLGGRPTVAYLRATARPVDFSARQTRPTDHRP
jgi:hypothetical protein